MQLGKNFLKSLVAVVIGNLFYFFVLMPFVASSSARRGPTPLTYCTAVFRSSI